MLDDKTGNRRDDNNKIIYPTQGQMEAASIIGRDNPNDNAKKKAKKTKKKF